MLEETGKIKPAKSKKIPRAFLLSPGGIVLTFVVITFEALDLFLPGGSLTLEIIPDLTLAFLFKIIAGVPFRKSIIPFLIERIPIISDILPTWLIRLFI